MSSQIDDVKYQRAPTCEELQEFEFIRVLSEDPRTKTANILGKLKSSSESPRDAILLLEKLNFSSEELPILSKGRVQRWISIDKNDIYHWYNGLLTKNEKWPDFKVTLIWPATETHIRKYTFQPRFLIRETPQIYETIVKPYIESIPPSRIQWIYNILSKKSEVEKILLEVEGESTGFLLLPDMKWDKVTLENLYLTAIVHRKDIRCLRDLNESHLPLLKNIRRQVLGFVPQKYSGVRSDELRFFIHYVPSYYHFHVHITHVKSDTIAGGLAIAKAYLLDDIIENLENFSGDYYKRVTLTYVLGENDPLFSQMNDIGARVTSDI
ncbi:18650_t:CDS:2 [Funneliformis geosporum]|uniref:m7GpppX diphosphatase n=1 Tax=Funneliformis geosporum TaxID=1117311 RepID=A0A9W4SDC4_9GLOM|nr:18650_t:CDS:2 [Funneliformis geosporum]CAI2164221.1 13848_t:CDS:2 [Funneliformis geosporum]